MRGCKRPENIGFAEPAAKLSPPVFVCQPVPPQREKKTGKRPPATWAALFKATTPQRPHLKLRDAAADGCQVVRPTASLLKNTD